MQKDDAALFFMFCKVFANKIIDEFFDVVRPGNCSAKEEITKFVAFNGVLCKEFGEKMLRYSPQATEILKSELERWNVTK